jgi:hypothetical protein
MWQFRATKRNLSNHWSYPPLEMLLDGDPRMVLHLELFVAFKGTNGKGKKDNLNNFMNKRSYFQPVKFVCI